MNPDKLPAKHKEAPLDFPEIQDIIDDDQLPNEEKSKKINDMIGVVVATQFAGPLPPPSLLAEYDSIVNDGAERIFKSFEEQSAHRRSLESKVVDGNIMESRLGQIFAFLIAIIFGCFSLYLAIIDKEVVACVLGGTTIVGLVTAFVTGKIMQNKDLRSKSSSSD